MGIKLFFDNSETPSKYELPLTLEDVVLEEMSKPQKKRRYRAGIEFSAVTKVEINKDQERG